MDYQSLFKNGSLKFVSDLVSKIVHQGLGMKESKGSEQIVMLVSTLIIVFILYKLAWIVWNTMKFMLNCLEW